MAEIGGLTFQGCQNNLQGKLFASGFKQRKRSTRNIIIIIMFLGSKVRRVRKADNLTAICEPIV
jgi:hypothetical protein